MIGIDGNMSLYRLVPELARRGVGVTLVSHHYEMERADPRTPRATREAEKMHYDSVGIFIVGPFDVAGTKLLSPVDRVFWGPCTLT